jgi:7,8-dihydropterin-6-yl-methyl-4-(beta-D-ribofuranosyl)aminobenzene 5'-phosphate synthase
VLSVNPKVKIYALKVGFGIFGADLLSSFYRGDASLPAEQRYTAVRRPMSSVDTVILCALERV